MNPSAIVVFEDGSEATITRAEAEALDIDFDEARQDTDTVLSQTKQQEAIAAEEARIAAIPDFPDRTVPDAVLDDATTEASAIFKNKLNHK